MLIFFTNLFHQIEPGGFSDRRPKASQINSSVVVAGGDEDGEGHTQESNGTSSIPPVRASVGVAAGNPAAAVETNLLPSLTWIPLG